jgi:ubiquinol-cytochrome c reductase cytochrome b subunit
MSLIGQIGQWFDQRLQLAAPVREAAEHPVPRNTASWFYVFGSAALTVFLLQLVTGIMLALIYVPSAGEAWSSLQALNHDVTLGWFIRAMHGWGSNFMVAIVLVHMVQVFLFGAYKFPRELTWIVGVFLLLMTLGMAFSGQVLRFDQDAYWGLGIGASIASRVPIIGPAAVKLMLGGPIIAGATLSRFFTLHVFVIPGMLIGFVGLHLLMVLKLGINEWPMPGRLVKKATYVTEYHELTKRNGAPFFPYAVWKDLFFAAHGQAGSNDYSNSAEARLLLFVAVRFAFVLAALHGDASSPDRSRSRYRVSCIAAISFWRRGKELAPAADRCFDGSADRHSSGNTHPPRWLYAVEPAHERLER